MFAAVRTIQISYELTRPDEEYRGLLGYLRRHEGTKPLPSMWLINSSKSAIRVRDEVMALARDEDEILVIDVTGAEWATTFADAATDWMELRMPATRRAA